MYIGIHLKKLEGIIKTRTKKYSTAIRNLTDSVVKTSIRILTNASIVHPYRTPTSNTLSPFKSDSMTRRDQRPPDNTTRREQRLSNSMTRRDQRPPDNMTRRKQRPPDNMTRRKQRPLSDCLSWRNTAAALVLTSLMIQGRQHTITHKPSVISTVDTGCINNVF